MYIFGVPDDFHSGHIFKLIDICLEVLMIQFMVHHCCGDLVKNNLTVFLSPIGTKVVLMLFFLVVSVSVFYFSYLLCFSYDSYSSSVFCQFLTLLVGTYPPCIY